jgi:hypothetical protein
MQPNQKPMTLIREASGRWQVEQPTPFDVPSSTGLKFVLNGQTAKTGDGHYL